MELIAGKLNNSWLESLLRRAGQDCNWVKAAIAYASGSHKLIAFCFTNNIPPTALATHSGGCSPRKNSQRIAGDKAARWLITG